MSSKVFLLTLSLLAIGNSLDLKCGVNLPLEETLKRRTGELETKFDEVSRNPAQEFVESPLTFAPLLCYLLKLLSPLRLVSESCSERLVWSPTNLRAWLVTSYLTTISFVGSHPSNPQSTRHVRLTVVIRSQSRNFKLSHLGTAAPKRSMRCNKLNSGTSKLVY